MENQIKTYFENRSETAAVYLFGSQASDRARAGSDVDLGILLDPTASDNAASYRDEYITELGRILKKEIHPVIMNSAGELILKQIFSKGRPILIKQQKYHAAFKLRSISKILHFNYYLDAMQTSLSSKMKKAR